MPSTMRARRLSPAQRSGDEIVVAGACPAHSAGYRKSSPVGNSAQQAHRDPGFGASSTERSNLAVTKFNRHCSIILTGVVLWQDYAVNKPPVTISNATVYGLCQLFETRGLLGFSGLYRDPRRSATRSSIACNICSKSA